MEAISYREAETKDLPELLKLISQSDMSPDNALTLEDASGLMAKIKATGCHKIYLAELDGSIVGTFALIMVQSLTHNGGRSCVIEDVVVKSGLQGQRLGRQMMNYAAEISRNQGCYKMVLSSGQARTKAHTFYEGLGFVKDGYRFALNLKGGE